MDAVLATMIAECGQAIIVIDIKAVEVEKNNYSFNV